MVLRREARLRGAVAVAATAAPVVVWIATVPIGGVDLVVSAGPPAPSTAGRHAMTVGLPEVLVAAAAASLGGWILLGTLERLTPLAGPLWVGVALPAFILSLAGPFTATTTAAMVALAGMHLAVAAVLVPGLALSWQRSWSRSGRLHLTRIGDR